MEPVLDHVEPPKSSTPAVSLSELRKLTEKIIEDPINTVQSLDPNKLIEIKRQINPLGTVIPSKKSCAVMSIFNMNEAYRKKLLVTALICFINRLVYEYEPERELKKLQKWNDNANENKMSDAELEERKAKIIATTRAIIGDFMNRHFAFDPDHHVRKAHKPNAVKPDIDAAIERSAALEAKLQERPENMYRFMRNNILYAHSCTEAAQKLLNEINLTLVDPGMPIEDKTAILIRLQMKMTKINGELERIARPLATADIAAAVKIEPPRDVFHHFDRYIHNHYEELREMTDVLYSEQCDIDDIVILYDTFSGENRENDAKLFVEQRESDFKQEPLIVDNCGITLLGPFKQNRDKINYLSKNTQLLREMVEQKELDDKLGADIIKKKMESKKKEEIARLGPDAPELKDYRDAMSTIETLGAKKGMTQKEQEAYAAAIAKKEDMEVPDGAIQTDVFFTDEEGKMRKKKLYTQAEAPLHLTKGSTFVGQYQPVNEYLTNNK